MIIIIIIINILYIGDSITAGSGSTSIHNNYPSLLHRNINRIISKEYMINNVHYIVNNYGKERTGRTLANFIKMNYPNVIPNPNDFNQVTIAI